MAFVVRNCNGMSVCIEQDSDINLSDIKDCNSVTIQNSSKNPVNVFDETGPRIKLNQYEAVTYDLVKMLENITMDNKDSYILNIEDFPKDKNISDFESLWLIDGIQY